MEVADLEPTQVRRKYALTKIRQGDYLLPSNDASTLWRIYTYLEDGSLEGWREGMYWAASRFTGNVERLPEDWLEWEHWEHWCGPFERRAEVIDEVLHEQA